MNDTCPTCTAPVIRTPDGVPLNPTPDLLGIHMPDGTQLRVPDKLARRHGHHIHTCKPPRQQELFQ